MGLNLEYTEGQTPIDEDEKVGLAFVKGICASGIEDVDEKGRHKEWFGV